MSNSVTPTRCSHQPNDIFYDERLAFVDHVCRVLIESRTGSDKHYEPMSGFSGLCKLPWNACQMTDDFLDVTERLRLQEISITPIERGGSVRLESCPGNALDSSRSGTPGRPLTSLDRFLSTPLILARGSPALGH